MVMVESKVPCTCSTWKLVQEVLNYMRACQSTKVFPKTKYTISNERGEKEEGGGGGNIRCPCLIVGSVY